MITLYISPVGNGVGTSQDPASYRSTAFWDSVKSQLTNDDVTVVFRSGNYSGDVPVSGTSDSIGATGHSLVLASEHSGGTVFTIAADATDQSDKACLDRDRVTPRFSLYNAHNLTIRGMTFTGPGTIGYVVRIGGDSNNVRLEDCIFENLRGVQYGAVGTVDPSTRNVLLDKCHFKNVGCDDHAHMMYNANGSHHITVRDCEFEECAGEYVRFRNKVDHCVVERCRFVHRGDIYPTSQPFISIPLYNDCRPGSDRCPDPLSHPQYEYFGTHFLIRDNQFEFRISGDRAFTVSFLHSGWDPPRRFHLLTKDEGELLNTGTPNERRMVLKEYCGIDTSRVKFYGNSSQGERYLAAFESYVARGATSPRWEALGRWEARGETAVNISSLLNSDQSVATQWLEPVIAALDLL